MSPEPLAEGLYESVLTHALAERLTRAPAFDSLTQRVDPADEAHVLARHLYQVASRKLASERGPEGRLRLLEKLLKALDEDAEGPTSPTRQLVSLRSTGSLPAHGDVRPTTPLSDAALLTNTSGEPSLGAELRAELDTSDEVDLLCAFVKWHGLRVLEPELRRLRDRGAPLRVITTTYMGATERAALDRLVREFGAHVRIQFDSARTRLHAKAWLFGRETQFDTAYVGSSNLSRAALLDGVEWNVRLSRVATPALLEKFRGTFDTYWNDDAFERYDPDRDRDRLDDALAEAGGRRTHDRVTISLAGLEVRPFAYQQEMLEALQAERHAHDRHRNLIVAATGTGKTVVAALDYRGLCDPQSGIQPSLLFIAHRQEILEQSLRTYREVLSDASFGELYVGGARPERWKHVFASVQSLSSYGVDSIPREAFDVVVIDEFHHAEAPTYRRLMEHFAPVEMLGLTATPERADGTDVRTFFGGRTAAELRLWDALGADLLCPFHYFVIADGTDLTAIEWKRGRYDEEALSNVYTGNDARARIVLRSLREKVLDPGRMRALGFCVSVAHAEFMARVFREAGIPALAVSGTTHRSARAEALQQLRDRRVNVLFAADLFNEGLDLPDVDTVLFLRPTESATIFLQQFGRGLRRTHTKPVLTVLDYVGHQRKEFRFDQNLRALTGGTRRGLERNVEQGFPFLPAGCQIVMDRKAQEIVLANIKGQLANRWRDMVTELRRTGDVGLPLFLEESGLELSDVLRRGTRSWTQLRRDAGLFTPPGGPAEQGLLKRMRAFAHVDDGLRASTYRSLLEGETRYAELDEASQRLARMLVFSLWPDGGRFGSYEEALAAARAEPAVGAEASAVVDVAFESASHVTVRLGDELSTVPLKLHARYQREEILAALDYASFDRKPTSVMQGVAYSADLNVDILFVTLKKSEADYSPTTMYRDYPISRTLFHWESQSTTSLASPTGQRYVNGTSNVLLFAREEQKDEFGTSPYLFLGRAHCVAHSGERPIAIQWRLEDEMPSTFFTAATIAAT